MTHAGAVFKRYVDSVLHGLDDGLAAVPAGHPLAVRDRVSLPELAPERFVVLRPVSLLRRQGTELCERAGFRPTVSIETDDLSSVRGMVAAGLGVAIVPAPRAGSPDP